jgi:hypothetical protein
MIPYFSDALGSPFPSPRGINRFHRLLQGEQVALVAQVGDGEGVPESVKKSIK